jgi:hypothetical protein
MGVNSFSKEERVSFEKVLEGFEDALAIAGQAAVLREPGAMLERAGDVIWRPEPYIVSSYDGLDQSGNFAGQTQLSVPASLNYEKSVPWIMDAKELRDAAQEGRLGEAARQRLASDINLAALQVVSNQGTLFVKRSAAAVGFDDVAAVDGILNEQGVSQMNRNLFLSTGDYNNMASDLSKASRSLIGDISPRALREASVGRLSGIETFKLDYAIRKTAAAGGGSLTTDTQTASANYWVPKATETAATGQRANVDNRYQTITLSSTTNVVAGDAFTIAGVFAVHHITKQSTGVLKTFRVISVPSSTTLVISPPIISNQGGSIAEAQYQNCTIAAADESATAAIVFQNTVTAAINPFFVGDALEIMPGRYQFPTDAGMAVMRASTSQGIELVMSKQADINTGKTKFRLDCLFGVNLLQPEMAGLMMFSQS